MRNLYNILFGIFIISAIAIHLGTLIWGLVQVINDANYSKSGKLKDGPIKALTLKYYFFYQLPFDVLNLGLLAHIFQWAEIKHTLVYVLDMQEYQEEEVEEVERNTSIHSKKSGMRETFQGYMTQNNKALLDMRKATLFNQGRRQEKDELVTTTRDTMNQMNFCENIKSTGNESNYLATSPI